MAKVGPRRMVLILVVIAAVACGGVCGVGYLGLRMWNHEEYSSAKGELDRYLDAVREGHLEAAYAMLCVDVLKPYGAGVSKSEFVTFIQSQPRFTSFTTEVTDGEWGIDGTYAYGDVVLFAAATPVGRFYLSVGIEDHGPRVCDGPGFRLGSRPGTVPSYSPAWHRSVNPSASSRS